MQDMQPSICLCLLAAALIPGSWTAPASSMELKQTFIDRCNYYISKRHPELFTVKPSCDSLWAKFQTAALENGCSQNKSDFDSLMTSADHSLPNDKAIFWSGVYDLVLKVRDHSNTGLFMLEDTLMGYVLNGLSWCGRNCTNCDTKFTRPFWIAASEWLARKASGKSAVILNATRTPIFSETTTFGQYELPLISSPRVTYFNIYTMKSLDDMSTTDSCTNGTIIRLKEILTSKGIPHNCTENPSFLVDIQKLDTKMLRGCNGLQASLLWIISAFFLTVVAT